MAGVDNVDNRKVNIEVVRVPLSLRWGEGEDEDSQSVPSVR